MAPALSGDGVIVSEYWAVKLAVYVAELSGTVMTWVRAPPSLQFANTYLVDPDPCGDVAAIV